MFHFIVNEIHRVEGYYMIMDSDGLFDVSDYSRMDEQRIAGIVDYCAELGLFDKGLWRSRQVLTSEEIQNRYMGICKSIHRKPSISDDYLLLNAAAPAATSSPQVAAPCPATHTAPVAEPVRSGEKEKDTELMQAIADFKRRLQEPKSSAGVVREESGIIRENRPQNKRKYILPKPLRRVQLHTGEGGGEKFSFREAPIPGCGFQCHPMGTAPEKPLSGFPYREGDL